jgi:hypothetical protein
VQKEAGGEGASESALISARAFTPGDGAKSPSSITIRAVRADMQDDVRLCLPFQVKSLLIRAIRGNDAPAIACKARGTPRNHAPLAITQAVFEAIVYTLLLGSVGLGERGQTRRANA